MTVIDKAEELLALSRMYLKGKIPYFSGIYYGLVPVAEPGLGTMGVTQNMVLYYDPDWLVTCTVPQIAGAVVHECRHVVHHHCERIAAIATTVEDRELANIAADFSFNPDNREAGWELPEGKGAYPEQEGLPDGLLLEEYYKLLKKKQKEEQKQGGGKPKEGKGGPGPGTPPPGGGKQGPDGKNGGGQGASSPKKGLGHGGCGGIAGNPHPREKELDAQFGRSAIEQNAIVKKVAQDVKAHIAEHGRGSVPADLVEELNRIEVKKSLIRWQKELDVILKKCSGRMEAGGTDFSLARPSKRSYARNQLRPGLVSYQPEVCIIHDTSGSMGARQAEEAAVQTVGIFKSLGIESAWYIQADTQVATPPRKIRIRDLMRHLKLHGRGGTDFDAALRAAEKLKPRPRLTWRPTGTGSGIFRRLTKRKLTWPTWPRRRSARESRSSGTSTRPGR